MAGKTEYYKNYRIDYWAKPGPCREMDWGFSHKDFDGAPDSGDNRFGNARTLEEAKAAIDDMIESVLPVIVKAYLHAEKSSVGDTLEEVGFERDTAEFENAYGNLLTALYEVEFHVNVETGVIVAVNNRLLSNEPYPI